jgi:hypothetical protein
MTTDNRTNEPTEAQVEAAAKAIADCHNPGMFERYPENWRVEARAALVAAQGAAPQSSKKSCGQCRRGQHGCCDGNEYLRCECSHGAAPQAESEYEHLLKARALHQTNAGLPSSTESPVEPFKTWFACWWKNEPNAIAESNAQSAFYAGWDARGLSSSGVDEDALAEVTESIIRENWEMFDDRRHQAQVIARAVAEWLKGQGR